MLQVSGFFFRSKENLFLRVQLLGPAERVRCWILIWESLGLVKQEARLQAWLPQSSE